MNLQIYNEMMEVVNQARQPDTRQSKALDLRHLSAQTTFSVIDYLTWWRTQRVLLLAARSSVPKGGEWLRGTNEECVTESPKGWKCDKIGSLYFKLIHLLTQHSCDFWF